MASDDALLRGSFNPFKNNDGSIDDKEVKAMSTGLWPPMFHHFSKYGIYVIRFFKEFGWKYVIVDDRIPCKDAGEIVFGQCNKASELWVSIIEKAYAKLHNNF